MNATSAASRHQAKPTLLVVGGGVAGLTAAHALCADFDVTVLERRAQLGGKCRSWVDPEARVPVEHGWRCFNTTYHNLFDTMRSIPAPGGGSVFDHVRPKVQRPLTYLPALFRRHRPLSARDLLEAAGDLFRLLRLLTWSDERIRRFHLTESFASRLSRAGRKNLVHGLIDDFLKVIWSADKGGFDVKVTMNMLDNFMVTRLRLSVLDGPTSETFIEPWRDHLERQGVRFRTGTNLLGFGVGPGGHRLSSARWADTVSGARGEAEFDAFLSALPNDELLRVLDEELLSEAPELRGLDRFARVWQNGVMVCTRRRQDLRLNVFSHHPWKLTVVSQAEHWGDHHRLDGYGRGVHRGVVRDVLSYIVSDWNAPGSGNGKAARACSPEEIYQELCHASDLEPEVIRNFDRRDHLRFAGARAGARPCLLDDSLVYDEAGGRIVANTDPVVSYPPGSWDELFAATTGIENLFLASTYCFNEFGCCATMEGANETGRRAANAVLTAFGLERRVPVLSGKRSSLLVRGLLRLRELDRRWLERRGSGAPPAGLGGPDRPQPARRPPGAGA